MPCYSDAGRRCHHVSLGNNAACAGSASHLRHQQGRRLQNLFGVRRMTNLMVGDT